MCSPVNGTECILGQTGGCVTDEAGSSDCFTDFNVTCEEDSCEIDTDLLLNYTGGCESENGTIISNNNATVGPGSDQVQQQGPSGVNCSSVATHSLCVNTYGQQCQAVGCDTSCQAGNCTLGGTCVCEIKPVQSGCSSIVSNDGNMCNGFSGASCYWDATTQSCKDGQADPCSNMNIPSNCNSVCASWNCQDQPPPLCDACMNTTNPNNNNNNSSNNNGQPCINNKGFAIQQDCRCTAETGGNNCVVGKYCWNDNSCRDTPEPDTVCAAAAVANKTSCHGITQESCCWTSSGTCRRLDGNYTGCVQKEPNGCYGTAKITDAQCKCGTSQWTCERGQYCYEGSCHNSAQTTMTSCVSSETAALTAQCTCNGQTCDVGKYCYDNVCNAAAKTTIEDEYNALVVQNKALINATCSDLEIVYVRNNCSTTCNRL